MIAALPCYYSLLNDIVLDVGKTLVALNQVYPDLLELERRALALQFKGFEIAAEYGSDYQVLPSQQSLADLKNQLQR